MDDYINDGWMGIVWGNLRGIDTEAYQVSEQRRMGSHLMAELLEVVVEQLTVMVEETLPVGGGNDPNVNLNGALSMAMGQCVYARGILLRRIEPDPNQGELPLKDKEIKVVREGEGEGVMCDRCDNPVGGCTCPCP